MKTYTLTFTEQELQLLGNGLSFRPYNEIVGVMKTIERQLMEQAQASSEQDKPE